MTNFTRWKLASLIRYCEGRLQLIVNRAKSRAAPLKQCAFLGYRIDNKGTLAWTDKAQHRFKERIREITSRNRARAAATCWHWEPIPQRCTWRRGAAKAIGG